MVAAAAESPGAPPVAARPARLVSKQHAGARFGVLNHVRSAATVAAFLTAARTAGLTMPVVGAVAVFTDERSASVLAGLPGLELDPDAVRRVLSASDPTEAGIEAAVKQAQTLLAVPGIAGVNLSGMASARGPLVAARIQAEVGHRIRATQP